MKYRKFGKTDLSVSEIGFGAWAIGGNAMVGTTPIGWGRTDDDTSIAAIRKSIECGINFFDTADFYGLGHSEELLGKELGTNEEVIIATKVGHRDVNGTITFDYTRKYILEACELSLKRLKRSSIDYYQLHTARMNHFETEDCVEAMQLLQKQGKIRYWGLSLNTFYPEPEAEFMMENNFGDGFQLVFNIINQRAKSVMFKAKENGYGLIARMPLQFGLLTGNITEQTAFNSDDHRSFRFNKEILTSSLAALEKLIWPLCQELGISKTSLALSYILSYDAISTVIPGIRTRQQAFDNTSGIISLPKRPLNWLKMHLTHILPV
ncbi:MAG: aldo/keto reductase [Ferruginibacter sp.]|nr:aldo/keto reductase [Ferruginibacter sp.]